MDTLSKIAIDEARQSQCHIFDWSSTTPPGPSSGSTTAPLRWTSPNGRIYVNDPATYPIDHTADSVVRNDTNGDDGEHGKQGRSGPPLVA